jgi:non-homologous end joining protein Ku
MPPRALWAGSIAFGLVNVLARINGAVHEHVVGRALPIAG